MLCYSTTRDAKKGEKMYFILRIEGTWENMRSLDSVRPECDDILTIFLSLIFARFALDTILFLAAEQHIILLLMQCWLLAFFGAAVLFMRNTNRKTKRATIGTNKQTNKHRMHRKHMHIKAKFRAFTIQTNLSGRHFLSSSKPAKWHSQIDREQIKFRSLPAAPWM